MSGEYQISAHHKRLNEALQEMQSLHDDLEAADTEAEKIPILDKAMRLAEEMQPLAKLLATEARFATRRTINEEGER